MHQGPQRGGAVWIARLGNERQVIEATIAQSGKQVAESSWTELKFHWWPDRRALAQLMRIISKTRAKSRRDNYLRSRRRLFRLIALLRRRYEFFRVLRVVELIAFYSRYVNILEQGQFNLAVTSNHSNPHGIAFNLAARKCGIPVVLISHGMPVQPVARLSFNLAVVHCEAARRTYINEGCQMARVLVHSRRRDYAPMPTKLPERLTVGVFLCKDVNEKRLLTLLERLLEHPRVSRILVRPHPTNLWEGLESWIAARNDPRVRSSANHSVVRDLDASHIVLAGNSSVLIEAVNAGRPSAYVTDLDHGAPDIHEFVASGLIYPLAGDVAFEPAALLHFYQRPDWENKLRLFANLDEDETVVAQRIGAALRELIEAGQEPKAESLSKAGTLRM
ncbi:MAG: hypothetical protein JWM21_3551 [Acidobacteria bacterium]|nr:hypothetical protein [Acidobacteriota bacterium]